MDHLFENCFWLSSYGLFLPDKQPSFVSILSHSSLFLPLLVVTMIFIHIIHEVDVPCMLYHSNFDLDLFLLFLITIKYTFLKNYCQQFWKPFNKWGDPINET